MKKAMMVVSAALACTALLSGAAAAQGTSQTVTSPRLMYRDCQPAIARPRSSVATC